MNIEKLESILHEMQAADFSDLNAAQNMVRSWADRISQAITDHLLADLQLGVAAAPELAPGPGGHGWDDDAD